METLFSLLKGTEVWSIDISKDCPPHSVFVRPCGAQFEIKKKNTVLYMQKGHKGEKTTFHFLFHIIPPSHKTTSWLLCTLLIPSLYRRPPELTKTDIPTFVLPACSLHSLIFFFIFLPSCPPSLLMF